ncbi:nucleotidyltransferase [Candidatus Peregrinibacteria bacterium RIFCSPLOWO2_02_FULL_48_14]|nr:MAG: nucleotidyltransferase [Candidatus Peregrinibacteria bacterium RIFCSPLOWO2_02_FULL_48_14]
MNQKAIRWKQRFQNFEKALKQLEAASQVKTPSKLEKAGIIQFFEMSMELAWKTLKDYLEDQGKVLHSPKDILKQAFQDELIVEGALWLKALEDRNLSTHLYDEETANKLDQAIRERYLPQLKALYEHLHTEL